MRELTTEEKRVQEPVNVWFCTCTALMCLSAWVILEITYFLGF
jgi:hypothetical protein